jgi:hypothetical protein
MYGNKNILDSTQVLGVSSSWLQNGGFCQYQGTRRNQWCISIGQLSWRQLHFLAPLRVSRQDGISTHSLFGNLARLYELGLPKHSTLLTIPSFGLRFVQLLLVLLGDKLNLRALLTWAVAACEAQEKQDTLVDLRDMTLPFKSKLSCADRPSVAAIQNVEKINLKP